MRLFKRMKEKMAAKAEQRRREMAPVIDDAVEIADAIDSGTATPDELAEMYGVKPAVIGMAWHKERMRRKAAARTA